MMDIPARIPRRQRIIDDLIHRCNVDRVVTLRDGVVHYRNHKARELLCVSTNPRWVNTRLLPVSVTCPQCIFEIAKR